MPSQCRPCVTSTATIDRNNLVQPRLVLASFVEVGTGGWLRRSTCGLMMMRCFSLRVRRGYASAAKRLVPEKRWFDKTSHNTCE